MTVQTNLHLVHDGVGAQDVVLLVGVGRCVLYGPSGFTAGGQANHHQDLTSKKGNRSTSQRHLSEFFNVFMKLQLKLREDHFVLVLWPFAHNLREQCSVNFSTVLPRIQIWWQVPSCL